jgi:hypothetical protein
MRVILEINWKELFPSLSPFAHYRTNIRSPILHEIFRWAYKFSPRPLVSRRIDDGNGWQGIWMTSSGGGSIHRMTQTNVSVTCSLQFQLKTKTSITEPNDYFQAGSKFLRLLTQHVVNHGCPNSFWQRGTPVIVGSLAGRMWINNSRWYTLQPKLLLNFCSIYIIYKCSLVSII